MQLLKEKRHGFSGAIVSGALALLVITIVIAVASTTLTNVKDAVATETRVTSGELSNNVTGSAGTTFTLANTDVVANSDSGWYFVNASNTSVRIATATRGENYTVTNARTGTVNITKTNGSAASPIRLNATDYKFLKSNDGTTVTQDGINSVKTFSQNLTTLALVIIFGIIVGFVLLYFTGSGMRRE